MVRVEHRASALRGPARFAVCTAVCVLAALALVAVFRATDQSPVTAFLSFAALMAVVMAASVWWWRGVDEAVREAHKAAWFWGGLIAVSAGAPFLILLREAPRFLERWESEPGELFAAGAVACALVQVVGYTIAWAIWWLKRR